MAAVGIGVETAGQLLVTAGDNPERLRSEAAFAMLCATAPLPASSGKTQRHRLNRGGDRQANSALHLIVVIPHARRPAHQGLRRPAHRPRPLQARDHPLPQALRRPRDLLPPQATNPGEHRSPGPLDKQESIHGSQYTSWAFTQRAKDAGLLPSMGTIGDAYDNAVIESFWARMQTELLDRQRWRTRLELANAIFEYLEIFHNRQRRHSSLGWRTPDEFEKLDATDVA